MKITAESFRDYLALPEQERAAVDADPSIGQIFKDFKALPIGEQFKVLHPPSTTLSSRFQSATKDALSGLLKGAIVDPLMSLPAMGSAIIGAPKQVLSDIRELTTDPATAIPEQAKRAGRFALGMLPMAETAETALKGEPLTVQGVARDLGRTGSSFLLPKVLGGLAKRGVRAGVKLLPGAGVELQEMAIEKANALTNRLTPGQPNVRAAYAAVKALGNPTIAMTNLGRVAQEVLDHERLSSKPNTELLHQATRILQGSATGWDWERAISEVRRMGEQLRTYRKIHGEIPKEMSDLYSALRTDVEQANPLMVTQAATPARPASHLVNQHGQPLIEAQTARHAVTQVGRPTGQTIATSRAWQDAQKLARRQFAAEDLQEQINHAIGTAGEGFSSFSVNKVLTWIKRMEADAKLGHPDTKARRFVQSWTPGELSDIKGTLKEISRNMAALPSMTGAHVGSAQRAIHGAIGALAGEGAGLPGWAGAALGVLGASAIERAMTTTTGRAFIRRAMRIAPVTSPQFNQMMGAWMRTQGRSEASQ